MKNDNPGIGPVPLGSDECGGVEVASSSVSITPTASLPASVATNQIASAHAQQVSPSDIPTVENRDQSWWAQELQREYVAQRQLIDANFIRLSGDWSNPQKWVKLALKVMDCGLQPKDAINTLILACQSKVPLPAELHIAADSPIFAGMAKLNALMEDEVQEMLELQLNPNVSADVTLYRMRQKLKYWLVNLSRMAGTADINSFSFINAMTMRFSQAPAWVCYMLNPSRGEVFGEFSAEAFQFFTENPDYGHAAQRLGLPKEMIFPHGSPYGD